MKRILIIFVSFMTLSFAHEAKAQTNVSVDTDIPVSHNCPMSDLNSFNLHRIISKHFFWINTPDRCGDIKSERRNLKN